MTHDHEQRRRDGNLATSTDGPAPGKRAPTDRLPPSLKGHERDVARFDAAPDYQETRATIDGGARDPLDFLDHERERHHDRPRHHRRRHHGEHGGGGAHDGHGDHGGGGAHGEHGGGGAHAAKPRTLLGHISSRDPLADGEAGAGMKTRIVVLVGTAHGVTEDATFQLCFPDGRPYGSAALVPLERQRITTALACRFAEETIPRDACVLVTIPPRREPDLHPDGSIGADDPSRLEA